MQRTSHDFRLSGRARTGALILLLLLLIALGAERLLPVMLRRPDDAQTRQLQRSWAVFKEEYATRTASEKHTHFDGNASSYRETPASSTPVSLFYFDPNTATEQQLLQLGLPAYTVRSLLKFRAHSPRTFRSAADLKKLYTLGPQDYERIAPYVRIPEAPAAVVSVRDAPPDSRNKILELNAATAEQLMALKGIGQVLSARIVRFRDALGGFLEVEQLREVYGLPDSTFRQLRDQFTVNITLVKQININIADEPTLAHHAYIGKYLAGSIIRLRQRLGVFQQTEDLRQIPLINEEKYRKIAPYLSTH